MPRNLTIIPTYNEKENILAMIEKVQSLAVETDILIVDDGSPDGTADIVKEKQTSTPSLHIIERSGKLGLGSAYLAGFQFAIDHDYDTLVQMDADFSHNPEVIETFLKEIETNDLVIGSRYINGINVVNWPLRRLMLSYFASKYIQFITRMPINDGTAGFKCWRVSFLKQLKLNKVRSNGYSFQVEMHFRAWRKAPNRIKEVPIIFEDRTIGQSKMSKAIVREAIWRVWWLRLMALLGKI
ncbi:MAG: polyprenol monophosphomannose synthase [Candidatus Marinimicrobia bacterium]|nr:polyprenol monophosphomannose synthase [Candidatus Neomarinimicrobiota bacterium]MCF7851424.1 polyprenol monophosphomannose synthase [Candidatus Neomarinimicrobiota bacterium]MCF7904961.1 polyprenol monophosphomannose synthase [Candidatus Neomarinimicrobiota bacterium]